MPFASIRKGQHGTFAAECSHLSLTSAICFHGLPPINMQVMTKILWGHRTPWLRRDVRTVTRVRPVFKTSPFIAIHVRRGDKVAVQGDRFEHDVEVITTGAVRREEANAMPHKTLASCQEGRDGRGCNTTGSYPR